MNRFAFLLLISFAAYSGNCIAQNAKKQRKYLPAVLNKMKLYLGAPEKKIKTNGPRATLIDNSMSFRTEYQGTLSKSDFKSVAIYVDNGTSEVYEFILMAKEGVDPQEIAEQLWGPPNAGSEWRFAAEETGLPFLLAGWVYQNKLIIAGALPETEWESGF